MKACLHFLCFSFAVLCLVFSPARSSAQGTLSVARFDGTPTGTDTGVTSYYEAGMTFRPIPPAAYFGRMGGGRVEFPENGSAYLILGAFDSLSGTCDGTVRFGLTSVDLSEFSIIYPVPRNVQFIGYRSDGTVVTTEFTTDGIIDGTGPLADFQTFYFDQRFSDLVKFEAPSTTYALDNLVFRYGVPEPSACTLFLVGIGFIRLTRRQRN